MAVFILFLVKKNWLLSSSLNPTSIFSQFLIFSSDLNSSFNLIEPSFVSSNTVNLEPSNIGTNSPLLFSILVSISIARTTEPWFLNSGLSTAQENTLVYFSIENLDCSIFLSKGFFLSCTILIFSTKDLKIFSCLYLPMCSGEILSGII